MFRPNVLGSPDEGGEGALRGKSREKEYYISPGYLLIRRDTKRKYFSTYISLARNKRFSKRQPRLSTSATYSGSNLIYVKSYSAHRFRHLRCHRRGETGLINDSRALAKLYSWVVYRDDIKLEKTNRAIDD